MNAVYGDSAFFHVALIAGAVIAVAVCSVSNVNAAYGESAFFAPFGTSDANISIGYVAIIADAVIDVVVIDVGDIAVADIAVAVITAVVIAVGVIAVAVIDVVVIAAAVFLVTAAASKRAVVFSAVGKVDEIVL